jgi:hypothetical protein
MAAVVDAGSLEAPGSVSSLAQPAASATSTTKLERVLVIVTFLLQPQAVHTDDGRSARPAQKNLNRPRRPA